MNLLKHTAAGILLLAAAAACLYILAVQGAEIDPKLQKQFIESTAAGDLKQMKSLVKEDSRLLKVETADGMNPVEYALMNQQYKAVRYIIQKGGKTAGETNLPLAIELVQTMNDSIQLDQDPDAKKEIELLMAEVLKADDKAASETDTYGNTALYYAASKGNTDVMEQLLKAGANPSKANNNGETALVSAVQSGKEKACRLLLKTDPSLVKKQDSKGQTILITAAGYERGELFSMLLKAGAEPDVKDEDGKTALMYTAELGNEKAVRSLLDAGADRNIKSPEGKTAYQYAAERKHPNIMKLLR